MSYKRNTAAPHGRHGNSFSFPFRLPDQQSPLLFFLSIAMLCTKRETRRAVHAGLLEKWKEVDVDDLIRLDEFGEFYYRTKGEPVTQSQRVSLNWMCREGCLRRFAIKIGNKWFLKKEVLDGTE